MRPTRRLRAFVAAAAIVAIVAGSAFVSRSSIVGVVEAVSTDPVLFGVVVGGLYLVRPLGALPTTPLAILVGYGYGVVLGIPIALVGVVTTVIPVFLVARWIADGTSVERVANSVGAPFGTVLERTGWVVTRYYDTAGATRGVIASRLAPIPSDVATCAAAVSGVGLGRFVIGTAIGELPWTVAAVVVGASAATVTTDGLGGLGGILSIACLAAAAVLLAGPAYRAIRTRNRTRSDTRSTEW